MKPDTEDTVLRGTPTDSPAQTLLGAWAEACVRSRLGHSPTLTTTWVARPDARLAA